MWKRILAFAAAAVICFSMAACDEEDWEEDEWSDEEEVCYEGDPDQTWAIYWYLCGSDLESEYGAATDDLVEMMEVSLPENVKVVVQTGGAWMWMNDMVDADVSERYVYTSEGMELVDQQPAANMGDPATLGSFLSFCDTHYPADHTMAIIWNHGGGSVSGAAFDENYGYDSLTLREMDLAMDLAYGPERQSPPLDLIGFDACLMATIDTAAALQDAARYLVASEELEPGCGWYYTGFLQELADHPEMNPEQLGRIICDTYLEECMWQLSSAEATLSVVDLQKLDPLLEAYESMGAEALNCALVDPAFFGAFGREAEYSENYGGNTRDQGYSNLVDLGDLAQNCADLLPRSAAEVMDALEACVVYQVSGIFRENPTGLSCYYSYNGDPEDFQGYLQEGCSTSFKCLYNYELGGELSDGEMDYIGSLGYDEQTLPEIPELEELEYPVYLDDEGYACMQLDADTLNLLKGVYFELAYLDEADDMMLLLGRDNDIYADWETGLFRDNFRGMWGALDGNLVYMEVYYEGETYTSYSIPILLNGEEYSLRVVYSYEDEDYYILGARKGLDENGMADKNLLQLREGDEITTLHYVSTVSGDEDFELVPVDTFWVTEDTQFAEVELGDGVFLMMFELVDARNISASSQLIQFTVSGDEYEIEIWE